MQLSNKQKEFWNNANSRWNVKSGATRSGKTYMDYYVIPKRIRAVAGKDGLVVILGNTKGTLQRNIIEPLQNIWGMQLVSDIRSDNTAMLFGEKCYCLGADKINQVNRIRGSSIKYCYGDEVVTWHPDVFNMLKSRLDKSYSKFDGTCNPEGPNHWFDKFLQSDADIYLQQYTIDDNPFNAKEFVENLKKEHRGTIFYDRYILGLWVAAEGVIYRLFADDPERFILNEFRLGKKRIIVPITMARMMIEDSGTITPLFDDNDTEFYSLGIEGEENQKIQEINMEIRADAHEKAISRALSLLSDKCGLGEDRYKFENSGLKTATEVVSEKSELYQNLRKHELILEGALMNLVKAIATMLGYRNEIQVTVNFDDSIIEDTAAEKQQFLQEVRDGIRQKWEYRARFFGETEEEAKAKVTETQSNNMLIGFGDE